MSGPASTRDVLRPLVLPIYAPALLQSIGSTALMPLVPLIALSLGFSVPAAAALALIGGIVGVIGPIPASRVMSVVGERRAMIATGCGLVLTGLAGLAVTVSAEQVGATGWHRAGYVTVLLLNALCAQVWLLGRQSYMGSQLPTHVRARGMSTLGGMMRIGQVVGPVLGAGVVAMGHAGWVYGLDACMTLAATALVAANMLPGENPPERVRGALRSEPIPPEPSPHAPGRPAFRTMLLVGLGIVPLTMSRFNRPLILPLLGASLGLDPATISLIFGAAAFLEILMFVPAGTLMDRRGRAAVAVPCLLISGVGYVLLAVLTVTIGGASHTGAVIAVGVSALCVALGNGFGAGIAMTLGIDLSPERFRTRHIARWNTVTSVGRLAGPGIVALLALFYPIWVAGAATGALCLAGGLWLKEFLPQVTPPPTRP